MISEHKAPIEHRTIMFADDGLLYVCVDMPLNKQLFPVMINNINNVYTMFLINLML